MRILTVAAALLLSASHALAEPITLGVWRAVPTANNTGRPMFDQTSWDCAVCGAAWNVTGDSEWLSSRDQPDTIAGFFWNSSVPRFTDLGGTSDYFNDHRFGFTGGQLFLDNGHGYTARSGEGTNILLVRKLEEAAIRYSAFIEDLSPDDPRGRDDWRDRVLTWTEPRASASALAFASAQQADLAPVPEPGTMLLFGTGLLGVAKWYRRRRHTAD